MALERTSYPGFTKGSERLTFEDLLSLCLRNTANSFTLLTLTSEQLMAKGTGRSEAEGLPSDERFFGNVMVLWAHIPDTWRTGKLKEEYDTVEWKPDRTAPLGPWFSFYHNILELVQAQGFLNPKVMRSLVE